MTDLAPLRKALILCTAVAFAATLSGCDSQNLKETFARIKDVPVDARGQSSQSADARSLTSADVQLAVNTARDLAVGQGGLLRKGDDAANGSQSSDDLVTRAPNGSEGTSGSPRFAIVDPLNMPQNDRSPPLDERVDGGTTQRLATLTGNTAPVSTATSQTAGQASAQGAIQGRLIQVGSFSTVDAARSAWSGLVERYPGIDQYRPTYQKITTSGGKAMVRLKVGPVADAGHAQSLCSQLDIHDSWCAKAG